MIFLVIVCLASFLSAGLAALSGFGIGSILTPLLAWKLGTRLAVVAVAIPHFAATLLRFYLMRRYLSWQVFLRFGLASAIGGLAGAWLHGRLESDVLSAVLGILLIFAGFMEAFGLKPKMVFRGFMAWVAGVVSGLFGGLVGNQGGLRSAALLNFELTKGELVATATAVGVVVDLIRLPFYLSMEAGNLAGLAQLLGLAVISVVAGTFFGARLLRRIPESAFHKVLGGMLAGLGSFMLVQVLLK